MLSSVVLSFAIIGAVKFIVNYIKSYSERKRIEKFLADHPEPWKGNVRFTQGSVMKPRFELVSYFISCHEKNRNQVFRKIKRKEMK